MWNGRESRDSFIIFTSLPAMFVYLLVLAAR
jgi:hypothetical protein